MASTGLLNKLARQCVEDSKRWFTKTHDDLGFLALCLCGEAGEFANVVKKIERGTLDYKDAATRIRLAEELTDVFIYLLNLAAVLGIDLEKSYESVRSQNERRFGK